MSRTDEQRLDDVREACERIRRLVERGRDTLDTDEALLPALERNLEILGEAATHVSEEGRSRYPSVRWTEITRFRILLAHHYHRVEPDQVWQIAVDDVPVVAAALGPLVDQDARE